MVNEIDFFIALSFLIVILIMLLCRKTLFWNSDKFNTIITIVIFFGLGFILRRILEHMSCIR